MDLWLQVVLVVIKAALAMGALLHAAAMTTWVERKGSAMIQNRIGANRASIIFGDLFGIWNTLVADPVKAITKEDFLPVGTTQFMHSLAPFMGVFPVLISFAVIPIWTANSY
jgi:NADH-quinone oxidoreductase subunit H